MAAEVSPAELAARSKDVYVFYTETKDHLIDRFEKEADPAAKKRFRFLARTVGNWRYSAFAIVTPDNLYDLRTLADAVPADPDTAKPTHYGTRVLRSGEHYPYFGFFALDTEEGQALNVLRAIEAVGGYDGSALVSGPFLILVEIGGDTEKEKDQRLAYNFGGVPGVTRVQSAQVVGDYVYMGERRTIGQNRKEATSTRGARPAPPPARAP